MRRFEWLICWIWCFVAFLIGSAFERASASSHSSPAQPPSIRPGSSLPNLDRILPKIVERAQWAKEQNFQRYYAYRKRILTEELDDAGRPTSEKDKTSQVMPRLSDKAKKKRYEFEINEEVLHRYRFEILRRERLNRRPVLVVTFSPKSSSLPVNQLFDPLLNRAAGTLWIDESELEIARADVRLEQPVNLVGGIVASVQKLHYRLERTRVDDGIWLPVRIETIVKARQFLTAIHTKKREFRSDFRKPPA